jgi:hypothetical protein
MLERLMLLNCIYRSGWYPQLKFWRVNAPQLYLKVADILSWSFEELMFLNWYFLLLPEEMDTSHAAKGPDILSQLNGYL